MKRWTAWVRIWLLDLLSTDQPQGFSRPVKHFWSWCAMAGPLEKGQVRNEALRELRVELSKKHTAGELDGFTLYLYERSSR